MGMPRRLLSAAILVGLSAGTPVSRADQHDEQELTDLLAVMQEETDLATRTRMNADYVPGIVSVLDGERMAAMGARTVAEAMAFLPGVEALLDPTGTPSVTVRGVPFPFNSGSIQVLLNSVPVGRESAGVNGSALSLPIGQVERIEFVRGPGSVLYGDYAFQGLLNVVTRKSGRSVEAGVDDHGARDLVAVLGNGVDPATGWQAALNVAAFDSSDAVLPIGNGGDERRTSGVASVARGGFGATVQWLTRHVDPDPGSVPAYDETTRTADLHYQATLRPKLGLHAGLQFLSSDIDAGSVIFKGDQSRAGVDLAWSGWQRQEWLFGVERVDGRFDRALFVPLGLGVPLPPHSIAPHSRQVSSVYVQDQIEIADGLRATLGARYDDNSEVGSRLTPRAALVWQVAEHHVLKAQFAEGFRAPTFFEVYIEHPEGADLDFEVNRTTELNYVYTESGMSLRATAYRARIANMVFRDFARNAFGNVSHADADGVELEFQRQLAESLHMDVGASHVEAHDNRTVTLDDREISSTPHWTATVGLLWSPRSDSAIGAHWNHVSARPGAAPDKGSYDLVDLAYTRHRFLADGLDLRLGVDNLFNQRNTQILASPLGDQPFPFRDRTAWLRLGWRW